MTNGEMKDAKRRALNILDDWLHATGAIPKGCGWYYELQAVIEDACECGAQAALGVHEKLYSEK